MSIATEDKGVFNVPSDHSDILKDLWLDRDEAPYGNVYTVEEIAERHGVSVDYVRDVMARNDVNESYAKEDIFECPICGEKMDYEEWDLHLDEHEQAAYQELTGFIPARALALDPNVLEPDPNIDSYESKASEFDRSNRSDVNMEELRSEIAGEDFGKDYDDLTYEEQQIVDDTIEDLSSPRPVYDTEITP